MRLFALAALCACAAAAQTLIPPSGISKVAGILEKGSGERSLYCSVALEKPKLNYSFRFRFGYELQLPIKDTQERGLTGTVVFRVTPEGGESAAYFADQFPLAAAKGKVAEVQRVRGEFYLGEGRYQVQFAYSNGAGGVCRRRWSVEARLQPKDRGLKLTAPPGAVLDRAAARSTPRPAGPPGVRRVEILMNADVLLQGTAQLLEPLLEAFSGADIRLSAFTTHGQLTPAGIFAPEARELVRLAGVKAADLDDIALAIDARKKAEQYRPGLLAQSDGWELLADLLRREAKTEPPADLIIFLSPRSPATYPAPPRFLEGQSALGPRVFYLKFTGCTSLLLTPEYARDGMARTTRVEGAPCPLYDDPYGDVPDLIEFAVARVGGLTFPFYSPATLAKSLASLKQAASDAVPGPPRF
jgi:hypothetical protein